MRARSFSVCLIAWSFTSGAVVLGAPPEYAATDITGWSDAQLETLPFFKRWVPTTPAGGASTFTYVAHTTSGLTCADGPTGIGNQTHAYRVGPGGYQGLAPFGQHSWGYWTFDGHDYHYIFGYVHYTHARDMNYAGEIVGNSTVSGSSDYASGAGSHAYRWTADGEMIDLTPDVDHADASTINNRGVIGGWSRVDGSPTEGFRLDVDGTRYTLVPIDGAICYPSAINGDGLIVGGAGTVPFASVSAGATQALDLPSEGDFEAGKAYDLNDAGWIVGAGWKINQTYEHFAAAWEPNGDGTWSAWALNELNTTPDILLENAVAIAEDGTIIATGRPDGSDALGSKLYMLTPVIPVEQACTPDIGVHPASSVEACSGETVDLRIELARFGDAPAFVWARDGVALVNTPGEIEGADTDTLTIRDATSADSGVYTCTVTNACGTSVSNPGTVSVGVCCFYDVNGTGSVDIVDFTAFAGAFNTMAGDANYDPALDFNGTGSIDIVDFTQFASEFNRTDCAG